NRRIRNRTYGGVRGAKSYLAFPSTRLSTNWSSVKAYRIFIPLLFVEKKGKAVIFFWASTLIHFAIVCQRMEVSI
ncbi:hypothetical protein KM914_06185, partial [Virgibacillus pantothenticus]|uniref:hypothetical protein n=2 Tax=Virgibacillus pantothenticus TaxID=1473 RepID=UPI001C210C18